MGIPQINITMSKQYAAVCGKYSNIYINHLKWLEWVNFFFKYSITFFKILKNQFNTDTPKKTYNSTLRGKKKLILLPSTLG